MTHGKSSFFMSAAVAAMITGCSSEPPQPQVSYKASVKPIIDQVCAECHLEGGKGAEKSGFRVDTYESLMKGTHYGPVIVAGNPLSSSFYRLVSGRVDPSISMPHGKESLSEAQIKSIELWIEQGAKNN